MAISSTPVQQGVGDQATGAITITLGGAPTNGNVLVLLMTQNFNTNSISSITQTNVTWHRLLISQVNATVEIWYGEAAASASATCTVNLTNTNSTCRANLSEWSGIATSSEADATSGANGSTTTPTTATITPTAGRNALIVAATRKGGTFTAGSQTNSFVALTTSNTGWQYSYRVDAVTSGTVNTGWTFSTASTWETGIGVLLAPAGGAATPAPPLMLLGTGF